jgi:hypothetical protein
VPRTRPRTVSGSTAAGGDHGDPLGEQHRIGRRAAGVLDQAGRTDLQAHGGPVGDLGHHPLDQPAGPGQQPVQLVQPAGDLDQEGGVLLAAPGVVVEPGPVQRLAGLLAEQADHQQLAVAEPVLAEEAERQHAEHPGAAPVVGRPGGQRQQHDRVTPGAAHALGQLREVLRRLGQRGDHVQIAAPGHLGHRPRRRAGHVVPVAGGHIRGGHRDDLVALLVDEIDAAAGRAEGGLRRADHGLGDLGLGRRGREIGDYPLQHLDPALGGLGGVPGEQQLPLVAAPLGGVEDGGTDRLRVAGGVPAHHRVDQGGQLAAVRADHVEGHLVHVVLHAQQRRVVGFVVDLAAGAEQIAEPAVTDQVGAPVAGPVQERLVDLDDGAVGQRGQIAARRMLVEVDGVVVPGQAQLLCHLGTT